MIRTVLLGLFLVVSTLRLDAADFDWREMTYADIVKDLVISQKVLERALVEQSDVAQPHADTLGYIMERLGIVYQLSGQPEESLRVYLEAIDWYNRAGQSAKAAQVYTQLGYSLKERDLSKAFRYMRKGIHALEETNSEYLSAAYDNLGVLHDLQGNLDSARIYFQRSLDLKRSLNDEHGIPFSLQKLAIASAKSGNLTQAFNYLEDAMLRARALSDTTLIAECLTYLGDVYLMSGQYDKCIKEFRAALQLAQQKNIGYLANYIYGELHGAYAQMGNYAEAYEWLSRNAALRDSVMTLERVRAIAELETYFETAQKELEIANLEQEVVHREAELRQNRILLGIVSLLIALLLVILYLLRLRQKLRYSTALALQQAEAQKERVRSVIRGEEMERKRIARELHDGLGQVLVGASMYLSASPHQGDINIKRSEELIGTACKEVRNISHALIPKHIKGGHLVTAINQLVESTADQFQQNLSVEIDESTIAGCADDEALALYRMLQELIQNSMKYSTRDGYRLEIAHSEQANRLHFEEYRGHFNPEAFSSGDGIGYTNLLSRAEMIGGQWQFNRNEKGGISAVLQWTKKGRP